MSQGCLKIWALTPCAILMPTNIPEGSWSRSLPLDRLMWAKIGPVGAVVAFAILIAIVCYITQTRRK